MALIDFYCLFFAVTSLTLLIGFVVRYASRVENDWHGEEQHKEFDLTELSRRNQNSSTEEEEPSFRFKFQNQISTHNYQEGSDYQEPALLSVDEESNCSSTARIHKCNFLSEKDLTGFVEDPETKFCCVQDSCFDSDGKGDMVSEVESISLSDKDCQQPDVEAGKENDVQSIEQSVGISDEKEMPIINQINLANEVVGDHGANIMSDSDSDSKSLSDGYSVHDLIVDSDGFLSERDSTGDEQEADIREISADTVSNNEIEEMQNASKSADFNFTNLFLEKETHSESGSWSRLGSEQNNLSQQQQVETSNISQETTSPITCTALHAEFADSSKQVLAMDMESSDRKSDCSTDALPGSTPISCKQDVSLPDTQNLDAQVHKMITAQKLPAWSVAEHENLQLKDSGGKDYDELESLWEHQDLIEQLRMELRKLRDIGLPTILEESESPKNVEDLKKLRIEEMFLHEDSLDELHKAYRSYRERMRKLDILNYQKMYAIGFLQLKDPLQPVGSRKTLVVAIQSILSQSFWLIHRKSNANPSEALLKDLQHDLEMVYVGQMCLSWEFLRWQYEKAKELPESDPYRSHYYNRVAGEFQQFQVIIQRFIENETFQGPRLPNYIRSRCVLRNLLQVPLIREDFFQEKLEDQHKGITSEMMEDVMEESIKIFWEFVKADKDETPGILKGFIGNHVELQDPLDYDLMEDIQSDLNKKEKKLKDILRTGNCLVKKLKKPKEDRSNQDLFFSQVDMKLVARVLRMARITTEQLLWCHKKLHTIKFAERRILREPSFLLFPC